MFEQAFLGRVRLLRNSSIGQVELDEVRPCNEAILEITEYDIEVYDDKIRAAANDIATARQAGDHQAVNAAYNDWKRYTKKRAMEQRALEECFKKLNITPRVRTSPPRVFSRLLEDANMFGRPMVPRGQPKPTFGPVPTPGSKPPVGTSPPPTSTQTPGRLTPQNIPESAYVPVQSQDLRAQQEAQMNQNLQSFGMTPDSQNTWNKGAPVATQGRRPTIPTLRYGSLFNQSMTAAPLTAAPATSYGNYAT